MPTVTDIVTKIGVMAQYIASDDIANGSLFGAPANVSVAMQIYLLRKPIEWRYNIENVAGGSIPSDSLIVTANWFYAWLGNYGLIAQSLISLGGVIPNSVANIQYSLPITATYTASVDGVFVLLISLPAGAVVIFAQKGAGLPLNSSQYYYVSPNITLTGGINMSAGEDLTYQYVLPINNGTSQVTTPNIFDSTFSNVFN